MFFILWKFTTKRCQKSGADSSDVRVVVVAFSQNAKHESEIWNCLFCISLPLGLFFLPVGGKIVPLIILNLRSRCPSSWTFSQDIFWKAKIGKNLLKNIFKEPPSLLPVRETSYDSWENLILVNLFFLNNQINIFGKQVATKTRT